MTTKPKKRVDAKSKKRRTEPTASNAKDDKPEKLAELIKAQTDEGRRVRRHQHQMVASGVYRHQLHAKPGLAVDKVITMLIQDTAADYATEVVKRMNPRDALEEMLVAQALWAHGRTATLSILANMQDDVDALTQINDCADKASNTFRRLMLALAEYRRPPRAGDNFTAIKQANIAAQQVVQNNETEKSKSKNTTNEQGCSKSDASQNSQQKALPVDAGGITIATAVRSQNAGVAVEYGAEDALRQGTIENECLETR